MRKLLLVFTLFLVVLLSGCTGERVMICSLQVGSITQSVQYTYTRNEMVSIIDRNTELNDEQTDYIEELYVNQYDGVDMFEIMDMYKKEAEDELGLVCEIE